MSPQHNSGNPIGTPIVPAQMMAPQAPVDMHQRTRALLGSVSVTNMAGLQQSGWYAMRITVHLTCYHIVGPRGIHNWTLNTRDPSGSVDCFAFHTQNCL